MRSRSRLRTVLAVSYLGLLGLLVWSRTLAPWSVGVAAALVLAALVLELRRTRREEVGTPVQLALAALLLAVVASGATTLRLERGVAAWDTVVSARDQRLAARLEDRLRGVIRRATAAAYLAADPGVDASFETLEQIRARTAVDAVALIGPDGVPRVWAGRHQGQIPARVLARESGILYPGGALFSYLYAVAPGGGGGGAR